MPACILEVAHDILVCVYENVVYMQDVRRRYPSHDGAYRDYMSTFDANCTIHTCS